MSNQKELFSNLKDILIHNYKLKDENKVLVIYDDDSKLSNLITSSFDEVLKDLGNTFELIKFDSKDADSLIQRIDEKYSKGDIVALVQSSSFRVSKFRWRNELCSRGLKVLEFSQLSKVLDDEIETFVKSLTYDYPHYDKLNKKMLPKITNSKEIKIISGKNLEITYKGEMDKVVLNDGNFEGNTNYGSKFPIGEIVSEALDLSILNGEIEVYAFPDLKQETRFVEPFTIKIEKGFVTSHTGPEEFNELIEMIKTEHPKGKVYVREFGVGINRNIKRFSRIGDPIAYERQEGLHFSLGMKHGIYEKKLWPKYGKKFFQRYHIDVYVNMKQMLIDDELVYEEEKGYIV